MEGNEEELIQAEAPKGRGRGRGGGVPLLPSGMWQSLQGSTDSHSTDHIDQFLKDSHATQFQDAPKEREFDREKGRDHQTTSGGKGFEKDLKGKDWDCPSCSNVNWSWRTTCKMCATPKPFVPTGDGECRDGVGGGFNERQERVSAAVVEIDEEGFDDFGRRIKKEKKAADRKIKEEAALKRLQDKYQYLDASNSAELSSNSIVSRNQSNSNNNSSTQQNNTNQRNRPSGDNQRSDYRHTKDSNEDKPDRRGDSRGFHRNQGHQHQDQRKDYNRDYNRGGNRDRDEKGKGERRNRSRSRSR